MALPDKAGKVISAPKIERYGESLYVPLIAREQARHDGHPDLANAYLEILRAAIASAAIVVERKTLYTITHPNGYPSQVEKKALHIRRADYAAWLQSIGEPPPAWWILEGETVTHTDESETANHVGEGESEQTKRGPGRPKDPSALSGRIDELREDAIEVAREIGHNPPVKAVALQLHLREKYDRWEFDTLKGRLRRSWWQPAQKSQK